MIKITNEFGIDIGPRFGIQKLKHAALYTFYWIFYPCSYSSRNINYCLLYLENLLNNHDII